MKNYEPKNIEKKWQDIWDEKKPFKCEINDKEKFYALIEFPYPSGQGLHVEREDLKDKMFYSLWVGMLLDFQLKTMR